MNKILCIKVNNDCNENCPYCSAKIPYLNKSELKSFNKLLMDKLENINFNMYTSFILLGGEIGLLSKEEIDILLIYLENKNIDKKNIYLESNGLFLDKYGNLYSDYNYRYHIISKEKFKIYNNLKFIQYDYLLWNEDSIDEIYQLSILNPNIIFNVILEESGKYLTIDFVKKFDKYIRNRQNIIIDMKYIELLIPDKKKIKLFLKLNKLNALENELRIDLY